jgi:uncharacterized protein
MKKTIRFDEAHTLHQLKHFLPDQAPLKDFISHNTLQAFQHLNFYEALLQSSTVFGYNTFLSIQEYRNKFKAGIIKKEILQNSITKRVAENSEKDWFYLLTQKEYASSNDHRIGKLRANWKSKYRLSLDYEVHPILFRILCSYLDQGISIWNFPAHEKGFIASLKELEKNSLVSFFKTVRAKKLLFGHHLSIPNLLSLLVGEESYYEQYLFDQQFSHPGWSGLVSVIEDIPHTLLDSKCISLHDLILLELLLEIDALDTKFGQNWAPLSHRVKVQPVALFSDIHTTEFFEVMCLWQDAFEWSTYDAALAGIQLQGLTIEELNQKSFQALFCMDDRECSIRRHLENTDKNAETFGTPGHFNVAFYYQPIHGKFYTKLCPAPVTPKHLIKEIGEGTKHEKEHHLTKHSHTLFFGWMISQTLGFWVALKLFFNIFRPTMTPATSASFRHLDHQAQLTIDFDSKNTSENNLQIGFTFDEMADRVEGLLKSIGLTKNFASIVYAVGHGATSVNNTHYAAYDCGACSGKPGSVNAKVIAYMANHPEVRNILRNKGIDIPVSTQFLGAIHDTTRDEIKFYGQDLLSAVNTQNHRKNIQVFEKALALNAKERSRRFETVRTHRSLQEVHRQVKRRSLSLFEPRPEYTHVNNAFAIVGRRSLSKNIFLDRRSFLNSYDYSIDPDGKNLLGILNALTPVGGGINLQYYFSRVDNHKLGAGTKLPHNVMGLLGVSNGVDGDLRPGLPSQMIEVHDPIRLLVTVEHFPEIVLKVIQTNPATYEWFKNQWVHLVVVTPEKRELFRYNGESFEPYHPVEKTLEKVSDFESLFEKNTENLPFSLIG